MGSSKSNLPDDTHTAPYLLTILRANCGRAPPTVWPRTGKESGRYCIDNVEDFHDEIETVSR